MNKKNEFKKKMDMFYPKTEEEMIYLHPDTVLKEALKFDAIDRQLTYLIDMYLRAKKQVEHFDYETFIQFRSIDEAKAYRTEISNGETSYYPDPTIQEWYESHMVDVDFWFGKLENFILPHIEARRQILNLPNAFFEKDETPPQEKIVWNSIKGKGLLYQLFQELIEKDFVKVNKRGEIASMIEKHFQDENGKPIKARSLTSMKHSWGTNNKPKRGNEEITSLTSSLEKPRKGHSGAE
jgi:hypothetical protein